MTEPGGHPMSALRPADNANIIERFSSPEGMPLVVDVPGPAGAALLSVAKVGAGGRHVLDTVAAIVYDERTGRIRDHKPINPEGLWTESQIARWVRQVEPILIRHLGIHQLPPSLVKVDAWWRELINGTLTRQQAHELAGYWVEFDSSGIEDPRIRSGLGHLYSFAMRWANAEKGITTYDGHGSYVHPAAEIAQRYAAWTA